MAKRHGGEGRALARGKLEGLVEEGGPDVTCRV